MESIRIEPGRSLKGEFAPPPDKSVSHRAVMFSSLAKGDSTVRNFLRAEDTESTMLAFRALGIPIDDKGDHLVIRGKGLRGLTEPMGVIDCRNSGTTIRLLSGVLSGSPFFSVLTGDESLRGRPMARVIAPLRSMGAEIRARGDDRYPPLAIRGGKLSAIRYEMPVASAQVKSSLLLAGLYAEGETRIIEPAKSRDHTERMLPAFGAKLITDGLAVTVLGGGELSPSDTDVPGDFSSAAFFLVASALVPGSELLVRSACLNPTRTGLLDVLKRMGAKLTIENARKVSGEEVGDIACSYAGRLSAVTVAKEEVPALIDEFPILCAAAALADGTTSIRGAEELRVKESDRIAAMAAGLRQMGVEVEEFPDGMDIRGQERLRGATVDSHGDHRIAMSLAVAGLAAEGATEIGNASAVGISFPKFFSELARLAG